MRCLMPGCNRKPKSRASNLGGQGHLETPTVGRSMCLTERVPIHNTFSKKGRTQHAFTFENKDVTEHGARSLLLEFGSRTGGESDDVRTMLRSPMRSPVLPSARKRVELNRSVSPFSLRSSSSDITACRSSSLSSSHSASSAACSSSDFAAGHSASSAAVYVLHSGRVRTVGSKKDAHMLQGRQTADRGSWRSR